MNHNITVPASEFAELKKEQRHILTKFSPLFLKGDIVFINNISKNEAHFEISREQIEMKIISITQDGINQKGSMCLLGLYAPYQPIFPEDDIPESVGGGFANLSKQGNEG